MKAMLLAAGRGERMKPLTDTLPKPLLSVGSNTLIEHNLEQLKKVGITEVVINVSYRAKQIIHHVGDGKRFGMQITYSYEPELLGTGGGIFQALKFLGNNPFLLLSSDIWTDYSFDLLFDKTQSDAHLVLVENPPFHAEGDFALLKSGQLNTEDSPKLTYASFAMIHPRLFANCQAGYFSISPLLEQAMTKGAVTGEIYNGDWHNVGSEKELTKLQKKLQMRTVE